ncbi:DUF4234 domain-containing protein [Oligoflexus tunisiensis]|uniref:DUF4234 domain-containing protein n=1 Tax=Oligoflexus tunisiensis TaxID=708132 RepID=UPI00114D27DF|nr:DUF4234 domain-containing protein [Oligoflexus tunisiensis]
MLVHQRSEMEKRMAAPQYVRSVAVDIILTIVLCGLWNIWVQARQMRAVNYMINKDKYHFLPWLLLTLITCGLWHIYHEYRKSQDISLAMNKGPGDNSPIVHLLLSIFGLSIIADALQQSEINSYFGDQGL